MYFHLSSSVHLSAVPTHNTRLVSRSSSLRHGIRSHPKVSSGRALRFRVSAGSLSDATSVKNITAFAANLPSRKLAAVYSVFGEDGLARYVGVARDVHGALSKHVSSQPASECFEAKIESFER